VKRRSKYKDRPRNYDYMAFVKTLLCAAETYAMPWEPNDTPCYGAIEADHMGKRPVGRKADDLTCGPLCTQHHTERGAHTGVFKYANKAQLREWMDGVVEQTQALYRARGTSDETLY
jgi:hypothetical protein